jgi:hypothetical protein
VRAIFRVVVGLVLLVAQPTPARADDWPSAARSVFVQLVTDPTTFAPAITSYTAERLDWNSSQVCFVQKFVERNPQFTISGLPNDVPIGYAAGQRVILRNSLEDPGASLINNMTAAIIERTLLARHPRREKLIRRLAGSSASRLP